MDKKSNRRILAILFTGVLMGALDISIVGPAIPSIEEKLIIEPRMLGWIFSIYVLFNLSGVSLFARLSDIFGRRNIYIISLGIFALGFPDCFHLSQLQCFAYRKGRSGFRGQWNFSGSLCSGWRYFPSRKKREGAGLDRSCIWTGFPHWPHHCRNTP